MTPTAAAPTCLTTVRAQFEQQVSDSTAFAGAVRAAWAAGTWLDEDEMAAVNESGLDLQMTDPASPSL